MAARLQVALDLIDLDKALEVGEKAFRGGAELVEAGTPLIKSAGVRAIRELRRRLPDAIIVADMKTMDAGAIEAELAISAGADVTTVLAVASEDTIAEVVERAHALGGKVMVDLMNVPDPIAAARRALGLGADFICLHVGVDVQRRRGIRAEALLEEVRKISEMAPGKVAVAGGINESTAPRMAAAGAAIIIVGGAIIRSPDPEEAARRIVEAIRGGSR